MDELKFLIVADKLNTANNLKQQIGEVGCKTVKILHDTDEAIQYINEQSVDAAITNIFFNGQPDGIQLASHFQEIDLPVFFVTTSNDPTIFLKARATNPLGYFVEPIKKFTLHNAIDVNLRGLKNNRSSSKDERFGQYLSDAFFIKQNNLLRRVKLDDVLWVKAEGNYSIIHTVNKKYILKLSLKKVLTQLPPHYFKQIQRAYIVATSKIEDIDTANNKVIVNNIKLPLGRNYKESLLDILQIIK